MGGVGRGGLGEPGQLQFRILRGQDLEETLKDDVCKSEKRIWDQK